MFIQQIYCISWGTLQHGGLSNLRVSSYVLLFSSKYHSNVTQMFPTDKWPLGRLNQIYKFTLYWYLHKEASCHKRKKLSEHFWIINLLSEKLTAERKDDGRQTTRHLKSSTAFRLAELKQFVCDVRMAHVGGSDLVQIWAFEMFCWDIWLVFWVEYILNCAPTRKTQLKINWYVAVKVMFILIVKSYCTTKWHSVATMMEMW